MKVQVIEKAGKPEWAIIAYEDYQRLLADAEMLQDVHAYDEAKHAVAEGEELVPSEVTYAILDGANPIRVWREHRGLSPQQLAQAAGISVPYLSQIESGKRMGGKHVLAALARSLGLSLDDIVMSGSPRACCRRAAAPFPRSFGRPSACAIIGHHPAHGGDPRAIRTRDRL